MVQYDILSTEQSQDQAKATTVATAKDKAQFKKTRQRCRKSGYLIGGIFHLRYPISRPDL